MPVLLQYGAYVLLPLTHVVAIMRMLTIPAISWTIFLNIGWIVAVSLFSCMVSINLMKRRLIV
jgi:lipooligosaccharide transport system permease protein